MQKTFAIVKFPGQKEILEILLDTAANGRIKLSVKPLGEDGDKEIPIVVEVDMIGFFSTRKPWADRRKDRKNPAVRILSVNFNGFCQSPGLLRGTTETYVQVEYDFGENQGQLGAARRAA